MPCYTLSVQCRRIPLVPLKAVARVTLGLADHMIISMHFGNDGRARDREYLAVPFNDGYLFVRDALYRFVAVYQDYRPCCIADRPDCFAHGNPRRLVDVYCIYRFGQTAHDAVLKLRARSKLGRIMLALMGCQCLGIAQPGQLFVCSLIKGRGEPDRTHRYRPCQTRHTHFINADDRVIARTEQLPFKRFFGSLYHTYKST